MKYEASQAALRARDDKRANRSQRCSGLSHRIQSSTTGAEDTSEHFEGAPTLAWITRPAFSHLSLARCKMDRPQAVVGARRAMDGLPKAA